MKRDAGMAKKTIVQLVDDIDGTPIAEGKGEHIEFAIDGVGYEIDLGTKNAKAFRQSFATYVEHATRTGGRRRTRATPKATGAKRDAHQTRAIREWAVANGYEISTRGRIPAQVEQAYNAAS